MLLVVIVPPIPCCMPNPEFDDGVLNKAIIDAFEDGAGCADAGAGVANSCPGTNVLDFV